MVSLQDMVSNYCLTYQTEVTVEKETYDESIQAIRH